MRPSALTRARVLVALCGLLCLASASATTDPATPPKKKSSKTANSSSSKSSTHKKRPRKKTTGKSSKTRGQKTIESERAEQIQEALIRAHYLQGQPSGKWDDATQAALRHYQADQGWQAKTVPDSRALIKLGLGPSHDHLLNPETAMTTAPAGNAHSSAKPAAAVSPAAPAPSSDATPQQ
jgi:Putative peptidoglycan binding domain